jgi:hypothetical protein
VLHSLQSSTGLSTTCSRWTECTKLRLEQVSARVECLCVGPCIRQHNPHDVRLLKRAISITYVQLVPADTAVYLCPDGGLRVLKILPLPFDLSTTPSLRRK